MLMKAPGAASNPGSLFYFIEGLGSRLRLGKEPLKETNMEVARALICSLKIFKST